MRQQMNQRLMALPGYSSAAAAYMYDRSLYQNLLMTSPFFLRNPLTAGVNPLVSQATGISPTSSLVGAPGNGGMLMAAAAAAAAGAPSPSHDGTRSPLSRPSSLSPLSNSSLGHHPASYHPPTSRFHPYLRPPASTIDMAPRVDAS